MRKILVYLIAIQRQAKQAHYHCGGCNFFGDHLLADRIYDGLDDLIDEIQENFYLGREEEAPSQKELLQEAANILPYEGENIEKTFIQLDELIIGCMKEIDDFSADGRYLTAGDNDLLGRICSDLQKKHGFIFRRLK